MDGWYYQYLKDEKLHYLTEVHPEDGILGELFFESTEEFLDYTEKNNITFNGEIDAEVFLGELLTKEIEIQFDKEHGEGAYKGMVDLRDELMVEELKKLIKDKNE